jgi:hypothetical protein
LQAWKTLAEHAARTHLGQTTQRQPQAPLVVDKWVSIQYVEDSGIGPSLRAAGYDLYWARADQEAERVELRGWEVVERDETGGQRVRYKVRDPQCDYVVLLRRHNGR